MIMPTHRRGSTLVGLLVVTAIIAAFVGLLLPSPNADLVNGFTIPNHWADGDNASGVHWLAEALSAQVLRQLSDPADGEVAIKFE